MEDADEAAPGRFPDGDLWRRVATAQGGADYAPWFAARFDSLAAQGQDVHGEAAFVARQAPAGARILDAGCGTGRVGQRLAELGYHVAGVDADPAMVQVARRRAPTVAWHTADLADLSRLGWTAAFDLVVLAGNVVPFVPQEALPRVGDQLSRALVPGGLLVCGFGLTRENLPPGVPVVPFEAFDAAVRSAGLHLESRFGGWAGEPPSEGYVVSVHRLTESDP